MNKNENEKLSLRLFIDLTRSNMTVQRELSNSLKDSGITLTQFAVIEALYHKGNLCVGEIKDLILTTSGNITVVISNLEKDKYIERVKDEIDKRKFIISLTDKGAKLVEKIYPIQKVKIIELLSCIDEENKKIISENLNKIWYKKQSNE
ncbi:MarR family winged helix-turn-helix transcriptional regulator [Miniphocaeibacter massiliensis]|uniref:MarR family winged helix-turn-helix transcriptional regulator n=1 Tax=Miniphocaeibacter massiliensis TaxID=2041841 RepID=UPI000C076205|nr:MarR family transcriptional regulator [Miniphocaeibacter massiliensis]